MSMHTQLVRGLMALPVAALLILAGAIAPVAADAPTADDCLAAQVEVEVDAGVPRTVDFHSMLPGALHIARKAPVVRIREG